MIDDFQRSLASENARPFERYVSRPHDEQIQALQQSRRCGNYLLMGLSGSGKTASLMFFSDRLLERGIEHQLIPCVPHRQFVPPLARINLVDDIDVFAATNYSDRTLIESLNVSQRRSLNVISCRTVEANRLRHLLDVRDVIRIEALSDAEVRAFFEKSFSASQGQVVLRKNNAYLGMVQAYFERGAIRNPRELFKISFAFINGEHGFHYNSSVGKGTTETIRPKLIEIRKSILQRLVGRPQELQLLLPTEFENLVGELFEKEGYAIEFTKRTHDGGVDIFAWKRDIAGEFLTVVQCKKYSPDNPVRVQFVREIVGSINIHNATAGAIFTTSRFTTPAIEESKRLRYRLSLHDYFDVLKSIAKHQP